MRDWFALVLTGVGATAFMDVWGVVRKAQFGIPAADYGLVGRWIGHMPRGKFRHDRIAAAAPIAGERLLGWLSHYFIGVMFAVGLICIVGFDWLRQPTLAPALVFGLATVVMPFFVMQPGMGAGVAASRTPNPASARMQSLITHGLFGLGLWVASLLTDQLW